MVRQYMQAMKEVTFSGASLSIRFKDSQPLSSPTFSHTRADARCVTTMTIIYQINCPPFYPPSGYSLQKKY